MQQVVCNSQNQKRQQFFPAELPSLVFQSLILLLDEVLSPLDTSGISIRTEGNVHAEDIELKAVHTDIGRLRFGRKLANRREQRVDAAVNLFLSVLLLLQRLLQSLVLLVESVYFFLQGLVFLAATNPQLRVRMLANKRGGEVLKYLPRLVEGGIAVNCQLVLCRGINDGDELRRTLSDLLELTPMVQSIAAVPCGVTDYREKLFKQTPYDAKTSAEVIDIMEEFGDECKRRHGKRIIYPSDEWYLKAGRPIPPEEFYEDFDQLENGVGMMRLYASEFLAELEKPHRIYGTKKMDVVTGEMASPLIHQMMAELHRQYPMVEVTVHTIKNKFFGGNVGVAGLVTATDIIAQCEGKLTSGTLGVPAVMLREEKDTFLDDITTDQLAQRLGVKVEVLPTSGGDEARALLRSGLHIARRRRA